MVGIIYSPGRDWVKWSVKILGGWGSCPPPPPAPSVLTALQSFLALMMVNLLEFGEWELLLTLNRLKTIRFDLNCKGQQSTKTYCDDLIYFVVVSSVISGFDCEIIYSDFKLSTVISKQKKVPAWMTTCSNHVSNQPGIPQINETSINKSTFLQYMPLFCPVRQSRAAVEPSLSPKLLSQNAPISWYTYRYT